MDQAQLSWITSFIWNIADDVLRDVFNRGKYRDVILPMTVLRRLDAVLESTKQAVLDCKDAQDRAGIIDQDALLRDASGEAFYNTSPFTLRALKSRKTQQTLKDDFIAYLDGFSPNVQDILKNFEFRNQIPKLSDSDGLGQLIEKFLGKDINLSPYPAGDLPGLDNHAMGTVFEDLVRMIGLRKEGADTFDTIIVITDRRILDQQIRETIRGFTQVSSIIGAVKEGAGASKTQQLTKFLQEGKKIIISTVQTFPFVLDSIGEGQRGKKFAIIIDEAHSSQSGKTSAAVSQVVADTEDEINTVLDERIKKKRLAKNASYFAFTATPKNKTLEMFGIPYRAGEEVKYRPFHSYTMKQAIQEGFILDVLKNYTPVASYYRLAKTVEGDPEYDVKKARKKLRVYVESHSKAIRDKAEIMVDHFLEQVIGQNKIGGQARAMVVTGSIQRAIEYFTAFTAYLAEIKSPYKAIVAFSGEPEYKGEKVSEAKLNGFPSNSIADKIQQDPYRFLICADKFQTGYDEPLLHTMYVDKALGGIKAVQTLSRLNRAHPKKHDVFVLDFQNDTETIETSFANYYRTTILSKETDPNILHTLKGELDKYQVYSQEQVDALVELYLGGADRDKLDPILNACVAVYVTDLDEDGQVDFKGKAKAFTRTYDFLATILPYGIQDWEKLSIFLNFLISKLPAPIEEDLAKGILEAIDMDSYRAEKKATMAIALPDADAEIEPVPTSGGGRKPEPEMDKLSNIVNEFNQQYAGAYKDPERTLQRIKGEIPEKVSADPAYKNARKKPDRQNAKIEHDKALKRVLTAMFKDDAQLFKQFQDNESFHRWLTDSVFGMTYEG